MSYENPGDHPVILFDGVCNLCNQWVQFIIRRDPEGLFRFAPLQSDVGEQLLSECGYSSDRLESVVLVEDGQCYAKSDAVVRTAQHLGGVYCLLGPLRFFPSRLRDRCYDFVAARRYRWFGKRNQCMMPTPDVESRFLAGGPANDRGDGRDDPA